MPLSGILTKSRIVAAVVEITTYSQQKARETTKILLHIISRSLASDEDVLISGFANFCPKTKKETKRQAPRHW
jgi:nucleoid DNA-binding protein